MEDSLRDPDTLRNVFMVATVQQRHVNHRLTEWLHALLWRQLPVWHVQQPPTDQLIAPFHNRYRCTGHLRSDCSVNNSAPTRHLREYHTPALGAVQPETGSAYAHIAGCSIEEEVER